MGCSTGIGSGAALWNIGYDWVLCADLPVDVFIVSYADNMLVLEQRRLHQAAAELAMRGVAIVVDSNWSAAQVRGHEFSCRRNAPRARK